MVSPGKERAQALISDIEDAVELPDEWDIGLAAGTTGYTVELRRGEVGKEEATIEFISDDARSTLYVHHSDVPTYAEAAAMEHGEERDSPIPGAIGDVDFETFDDAAAVVQELVQPGTFDELLAWLNDEDNEWKFETAIVEHMDVDVRPA